MAAVDDDGVKRAVWVSRMKRRNGFGGVSPLDVEAAAWEALPDVLERVASVGVMADVEALHAGQWIGYEHEHRAVPCVESDLGDRNVTSAHNLVVCAVLKIDEARVSLHVFAAFLKKSIQLLYIRLIFC